MTDETLTVKLLTGLILVATPQMASALDTDSIYPQHELNEVVITRYKTNRHNLSLIAVSTIGRAQI